MEFIIGRHYEAKPFGRLLLRAVSVKNVATFEDERGKRYHLQITADRRGNAYVQWYSVRVYAKDIVEVRP